MSYKVTTTWTCGRCGCEVEQVGPTGASIPEGWNEVRAGYRAERMLWSGSHLCGSCMGSLAEFMGGVATVTEAAATFEGREAVLRLFGIDGQMVTLDVVRDAEGA